MQPSGRRLQDIVTTSEEKEEEVFFEDGKRCVGYTVRQGKKYCAKPVTLTDGSVGCE